ncbi:MAG: hypothetical protein AAF567_05360 [Actinomycetota bacterium]
MVRAVSLLAHVLFVLSACGGAATPSTSSAASSSDPAELAASDAPVALLSGEFETISGDAIDLGSLEGQDVVFWFWAPW